MSRPDPYLPHRRFIAPALVHPAVWRILIVILGFEVVFEATPFLIAGPDPYAPLRPVTAIDTLVEFAAFAIPCAALLALVRLLHRRGLRSLLGPREVMWRDLWRVSVAVGLVLLVQEPLLLWNEWPYLATMRPLGTWLALWPFALAALLIQVGTEEIYFRGYLQQQCAALSLSPWVWILGPSLFFGLAHFVNGVTPLEGLVWAIWATALGCACADLTARTGSLGAAIGLHLANNVFATLITGVEDWPASGLALFLYPWEDPAGIPDYTPGMAAFEVVYSFTGLLVMWLAARVALRR